MTTTPTPRHRAIGALVGLAAGDAVGTTVEFKSPGSFTPLTDMVGGGPFRLRAGEWTDDTSMALCLAESLLDRPVALDAPMDLADQCRRYVRWRTEGYLSSNGRCFDIGGTTSAALRRFTRTGEATDTTVDSNSAANGSLMRLAPVPIRWHADLDLTVMRAAESSRTTHGAPRPVDACRVLAAMVAALINGETRDVVLDATFWRWGPLDPAVQAVADGSWRDQEPPAIRGTGYCVDALEAAIWAFAGADSFADTVLRAANLGDDADTTAAIAGQLAGAYWGVDGIPAHWRAKLVLVDRIISLAANLFDAGVAEAADQPISGPVGGWDADTTMHVWRVDDTLIGGEYPASIINPERSVEKLALLIDYGVRTTVDLTVDGELTPYQPALDEAAAARGLDLQRMSFPIPDMGTIPLDAYDPILAAIDEARSRGRVFVHCWGGMGRTSTVIGCVLVAGGMSANEALARINDSASGRRRAISRRRRRSRRSTSSVNGMQA